MFSLLKKAQPPGKTTGSHRQTGDWQGPFNFEGLSACTGAQPGLGATALSPEKQLAAFAQLGGALAFVYERRFGSRKRGALYRGPGASEHPAWF